jgi:transposase
VQCGHSNNADINAAQVLKKRFLTEIRAGKFSLKRKQPQKIAYRRKKVPPEQRCQPMESVSDLCSA